jgi:hypothetical protein
VLDDPDRVVVGVTLARAEVVETAVAATEEGVVPAEPEVISKGKKTEDEE